MRGRGELRKLQLCFLLAIHAGAVSAAEEPKGEQPPDEASEVGAAVGEAEETVAEPQFPERFAEWLAEVEPIISLEERRLFVALGKDYQRDAFIRRFWQVRDPFPETGRNEFRERWTERVQYSLAHFGSLSDDRSRMLLVHGAPQRIVEVRCTTTRKPAEIWLYTSSDQVDFRFVVLFLRRGGLGPARIWHPGAFGQLENVMDLAGGCINGYMLRDVARDINRGSTDYGLVLSRVLTKPRPRSREWVSTFASYSTDLPTDAEPFGASSTVDYLGRHQQRTVLQGVVRVPLEEATVGDFGGYRSYNFLLTGEVVLRDQLFESFRYRFGFDEETLVDATAIPMAFQRYLRPGEYLLILKVEDLNSGRFFRHERTITVPKLTEEADLPPPTDPDAARIFQEATAAVASGETSIRVIPPSRDLQTGLVRIDTLATGEEIDRVVFLLNDRPILQKNRPPYNVELDLGPFPKLHSLRVEALDEDGAIVAEDETLLNAGGQRFTIRLVEPRNGREYRESLRARVEVKVPEGATLDRIELFLNERRVATLYQAPWVQPIQVPRPSGTAYVRAVAYLTDGNATEDLVFVNSPSLLEEVDVQFVELFASVYDRDGRPLSALDLDDFTVLEDGKPQSVARFERVQDLPIHVGVLIDNSASMQDALGVTRRAALAFFEEAIRPKDRAAVITFNRFPYVAVKLTNDIRSLGGGLAGLTAEGQTALFDSVMFSLYYFSGITGQRAILILSDGRDEVSRFDFEETLEYARRAGVTIYSIGLKIAEVGARRKLSTLAEETGGASYFIEDVADLEGVYETIQRELRSQYLIAYQSANTTKTDEFRSVELKVRHPGAVVKTMSGYYP